MCGIVGFWGNGDDQVIRNMTNTLYHRGPDEQSFANPESGLYLGHTRLAILDLSPSGSQPMVSHDGRYYIVFNGEIYNYQDIKTNLKRNWKGHSDTEVLLECVIEYGLEKTLELISGMFAFALYDIEKKKLFLARDRFGEKPLYYSQMNGHFFFGSELKAIVKHPSFKKRVSKRALKSFFKYNYIPAPYSIFENTYKLKPAHYIEFNIEDSTYIERPYWKIKKEKSFNGDYQDALSILETKLMTTVKEQMVSDVSIGAFLSGGVDSSTVVALMQKVSSKPVKTFSIGFNEKKFNEAVFAKIVANHLGTAHTEMYVSAKDALDVIPKLSTIYDEPFSDSSQIPTCLVSELTKKHVTVALSGDAGDEVFGGYNRYFFAPKIYNRLQMIPAPLKKMVISGIDTVPNSIWDKILPFSTDKLYKLASVLDVKSEYEIYNRLISHWKEAENPVLSEDFLCNYEFDNDERMSFEEKMMMLDTNTYLPDDILVKVDRAGMAVSLESRIPFLDHRVVEFAWSLPLEFKIKNGVGKRILRDILHKHVPRELIDRPKMGFGVPLDSWLRHELKEWAENLLDEQKIKSAGLLNYSIIKKKWDEHQSGKMNWQYLLWDVLMFQDWYENNFIC